MGDVLDLNERRWDADSSPNAFTPIEALRALIRKIETGDINPQHLVVAIAAEPTGPDMALRTLYFQAGAFDYYGQVGLVSRVLGMMGGNVGGG